MNKAEAKAVVTIPMKGRYFLHKNDLSHDR